MISLTREQAEFALRLCKSYAPPFDTHAQSLASEIERQLAGGSPRVPTVEQREKETGIRCACSKNAISIMCPYHGEELAKEEIEHESAQRMDAWLAARGKEKLT